MAAGSMEANEAAEAYPLENKESRSSARETIHRWLERKPVRFAIVAFVLLAIGGAVEIIPMIFVKSNVPTIESVKPYTPLELEGRDIYISEGCYTCHSQMVRPFRWETDRYGEYSKIGEFVYDHPFQWGSRRTGPDLARTGVITGNMYKTASWHYNHFMDPQRMNEQSIMPKYDWFAIKDIDLDMIPAKIRAMQTLGVPYEEGFDERAIDDLKAQAQIIADDLKQSGIEIEPTKQMIAMIAYLHKLGRDITPVVETKPEPVKTTSVNITEEMIPAGKASFQKNCIICHGPDGKGNVIGPDLTDNEWIIEKSPEGVYENISNGKIEKGMTPFKGVLSEEEITQLTAFVLLELNKN